jgi:LacI family transcriptional regulator
MMACKTLGFEVPNDIGIVGFSNWQFCAILDPSLSSVSQPGFQIGATATEILLDLIEKKIEKENFQPSVVLDTELLIRQSSVRIEKD